MRPRAEKINTPTSSGGSAVIFGTHAQAAIAAQILAGGSAPHLPVRPANLIAPYEDPRSRQRREGRSSCLFTATVHRTEGKSSVKGSEKGSLKGSQNGSPKCSPKLVGLMQHGRLRRIGPARGGRWEILE